jgi:hypothetical protein
VQPKKRFQFARWSELDWSGPGGFEPAGVVVQDDRGSFHFSAYAGYGDNAEINTQSWLDPPKDDPWGELSARSGRNSQITDPEYIMARDFSEAIDRARLKVASDYYKNTGKVVLA